MSQESQIIAELSRRKCCGDLRADIEHFKGDFTALSVETVAKVERQLGFKLPDFLRRIYTEIANGGFGYSYGLLGLTGGMLNEDGNDVVKQYLMYREPDPDDIHWKWPQALLPIGHLGCAMYHCVQCDVPEHPVIWFEPNGHPHGQSWDSAFISFCPSFAGYLSAWLAGEDLFHKFLGKS